MYAVSQLNRFDLSKIDRRDDVVYLSYTFDADDVISRDIMMNDLSRHVRDAVMAAHVDRNLHGRPASNAQRV